ncbi:MAG: alanyl-tRNA synthetase [Solirubrobacterales bacterium]|nr:alanyl-tRNA synthetase [Solirubrobacterales bacterium]
MNSAEIRETFLSFFEAREHLRRPSGSLVPAPDDRSTLLTVAGMQPLKPYFEGREEPPALRLTTSQRCFRTPDIEEVGNTRRHLTFFEMLGNFSFGDYFKERAVDLGWELSREGFGFDEERIWVTVFAGDDELGIGPDEEAIELWRAQGVPEERIVRLPRKDNFWQAGPFGPCGPCSEMYLDRGEAFGGPDDLPGDDTDRFLEYWNLVFMQLELHEDGTTSPLPKQSIDTGLGLERMAAIQQGVDSVFDTDLLRPLVDLAEELSGSTYGSDPKVTRAMRIIADHSRGTVNLLADGVVPSNEDRGYVLRRIMRRAIQQGRVLGLESPYLGRFADLAIELLAGAYPHLEAERASVMRWVDDEERSFGHTLERGSELLATLVRAAKDAGAAAVEPEEVFKLHDTYGFPYDLTRELLAEEGLSVDDAGFQALMSDQRERARRSPSGAPADGRARVVEFVTSTPKAEFVGYETLAGETAVVASRELDGEALVKLEESPFYPEGGGQVSDSGIVRAGEELEVLDVYRVGDDQAVRVRGDAPEAGAVVEARVDDYKRHATMRNHTATHLLHAALRERLGTHVRQAGSAVRPDKLRFDFTHSGPLTPDELRDVEDRVNEWVKRSTPVRAVEMERAEAEALGAMALFGEKYGDWVRVVEVEGVSRELCGGTHVASSAEVGIFTVVSEGSSAANVRRIEALTGPAAIDWFRGRSAELDEAARVLGSGDALSGARRASERLAELESSVAEAVRRDASEEAEVLAAAAEEAGGIKLVTARTALSDQDAMLQLAERVRAKLGDAAVVLGGAADGKVALVALFADAAVERGLSAATVVREAAAIVGGGGGGRDNMAQAGGRDPERLDDALAAARSALVGALGD